MNENKIKKLNKYEKEQIKKENPKILVEFLDKKSSVTLFYVGWLIEETLEFINLLGKMQDDVLFLNKHNITRMKILENRGYQNDKK